MTLTKPKTDFDANPCFRQ